MESNKSAWYQPEGTKKLLRTESNNCCDKCSPKYLKCGKSEIDCRCHGVERNNWKQRFDEQFNYAGDNIPRAATADQLKSFISQELEKAREEGRQEGFRDGDKIPDRWNLWSDDQRWGYLRGLGYGRVEERQRLLKLIEEMKTDLLMPNPSTSFNGKIEWEARWRGWDQALEELKEKLTKEI